MKRALILITILSFIKLTGQNNLLDTSSWTVGTGNVNGFYVSGLQTENERLSGIDPHGNTSVIWAAKPSGDSSHDGGFYSEYIPIDPNKTYRMSVWMKKTGSNSGGSYFGLYIKDAQDAHTAQGLSGNVQTNPYFMWNKDLPVLGKWYLLVGYVHPENYSGPSLAAAYDADTGLVINTINIVDYKFGPGSSKMMNRAFLWQDTNVSDRQYYWEPAIHEVNGQEPTIQELLDGPTSGDVQSPTAPTVSTIGHTDSTIDLSWGGATDNVGVTNYKVFKDGTLEATLGNVSTYQAAGLISNTSYSFTVSALDAAGNESPLSNVVSVTTNSAGGSSGGGGSSVWTESGSTASYIGGVAIGTSSVPAGYKLAVDGHIRTREIRVDQDTWPDYVFDEHYDLPSLEEIQKHIKEKGHLPNMPSAKEAEEQGVDLGEMDRLLLKQIEELMLHILNQDKKIEELETTLLKMQ